ncbi:MAG: aquaporin [Thermoplasmata archaeon]|nr:aquaporin [Thermoplasmata archaeon]
MPRSPVRTTVAEILGTFALVAMGTGAIVAGQRWDYLPVWLLAVAWFFAVWFPVLAFARISGAHLNPAVTTALAASGRLPWREWPFYVGGQLIGALAGSVAVLEVLGRGLRVGAAVPAPGYVAYVFPVELLFTGLLVVTVFRIADLGEGRYRWRLLLPPLVVGLATYAAGPLTGVSLNPARSIAPAVVSGVYTDLWIYLLAQPAGALLVAAVLRPGRWERWARRWTRPAPAE